MKNFIVILFSFITAMGMIQMLSPEAIASTSQNNNNEEAAVLQSLHEVIEGFNTKNTVLMTQNYAEDIDFVPPVGVHTIGQAKVKQDHDYLFQNVLKNSAWKSLKEQVRFLRPDVAVVVVAGYGYNKVDDSRVRNGIISTTLTKNNGTWQIESWQMTWENIPEKQ